MKRLNPLWMLGPTLLLLLAGSLLIQLGCSGGSDQAQIEEDQLKARLVYYAMPG